MNNKCRADMSEINKFIKHPQTEVMEIGRYSFIESYISFGIQKKNVTKSNLKIISK